MRAWRVEAITEHGAMRMVDLPPPEPGERQYVIGVQAAGLNFLDALMLHGRYQVKPQLPFTPGVEVVGRVLRVGDGAPLKVGARVSASVQGGFAELALAEADAVCSIPDDVPAADAVALFGIAYPTSYYALHDRGGLHPAATVLVHAGAGGVGSAAVQIALAAGARVIATAGGADKVAACRAMGAELAIDYAVQDWVEAVRGHTGGRGVDIIFDPVGGEIGEASLRCLAWHGRYLVVGFAAGPIPALAANRLLLKEASAVGVYWGGAVAADPAVGERTRAAVLALYREGKLKPLIRGRFPLERADAALASLAGRGSVGKVVLEI